MYEAIRQIDTCIERGEFDIAEQLCHQTLRELEACDQTTDYYVNLFTLAGLYTDLGHYARRDDLSHIGFELMDANKEQLLSIIRADQFYYNYANAKSNLISVEDPDNLTFHNIEEFIVVKNCYWKAFKESQNNGDESLELLTNLANILKRQLRLSEALRYYDYVLEKNPDIVQAMVNRSDALKTLNMVSESYTIKMLREIAGGYRKASLLHPMWSEAFEYQSNEAESLVASFDFVEDDEEDEHATSSEFDSLSDYRKFCIKEHLTLSEHALYCGCIGSARDNLTIPLTQTSIGGDFVPKMELVLNRIKSEFSLARKNYYDYFHPSQDSCDLIHEECFSELFNGEILGLPVEKLRTSFRLCFGILDKIASGICSLYDIGIDKNIYFQDFWRLDQENRREKFESIKNPGLLALYSIATDLNKHKDGEWAHFKEWRNALEHGLLIIVEDDVYFDPYETLSGSTDIVTVQLNDFIALLKKLLQLTRCAIFSFVFAVRHEGLQTRNGISIPVTLGIKD